MLTPNEKGTIRKRVRRGAALLDQKKRTWFKSIDLDGLAMWDGSACILGQTYGEYVEGLYKVGLGKKSEYSISGFQPLREGDPDGIKHGFNLDDLSWGASLQWSFLTECWAAEIQFRRAASSKKKGR